MNSGHMTNPNNYGVAMKWIFCLDLLQLSYTKDLK